MTNIQSSFSNFLIYCKVQKNLSDKTIKAYTIDCKQFMAFLSSYNELKTPKDINKDILRTYLQSLTERYKTKTVKRKIACLKAFFNYLEFEDEIIINPFRKIKIKLKEPFTLPKVMTLKEIERLFRSAYTNLQDIEHKDTYTYSACVRDIAVLELLFATGLRVSELCNLKDKDVDIDSSFVRVRGKGNKERIIYLGSSEVKAALSTYKDCFVSEIQTGSYFFINRLNSRLSEQSVRFMVKKYAKEANIDKHITPHVFRHSFATLLLEEGVDIKYIQNFLGHSSIMTTQIYTHVNKEKQKEILSSKHPRRNMAVLDGSPMKDN